MAHSAVIGRAASLMMKGAKTDSNPWNDPSTVLCSEEKY
jgi:hypothetical protein